MASACAGIAGRVRTCRRLVDVVGPLTRAAVEAAQGAWRETNPWHRLYSDVKARTGKAAKAAVARKVLIACWHVLSLHVVSLQEPFKPSRPRGTDLVPASSSCFLAA